MPWEIFRRSQRCCFSYWCIFLWVDFTVLWAFWLVLFPFVWIWGRNSGFTRSLMILYAKYSKTIWKLKTSSRNPGTWGIKTKLARMTFNLSFSWAERRKTCKKILCGPQWFSSAYFSNSSSITSTKHSWKKSWLTRWVLSLSLRIPLELIFILWDICNWLCLSRDLNK